MSQSHMLQAIKQAKQAAQRAEVPVGAVIVDENGTIIAACGNQTRHDDDPTAHAEILAIRAAAQHLGKDRLAGCSIYVTLEPCAMCAGAISHARLTRLLYGASDPKSGGTAQGARVFDHPQCHHKPEVLGGIEEEACETLLKDFFGRKRRDIGA